jgi:hypothetical protein
LAFASRFAFAFAAPVVATGRLAAFGAPIVAPGRRRRRMPPLPHADVDAVRVAAVRVTR